jgi:hypothetical protein
MARTHYIVRRTYGAVTPPPVRGYVLTAGTTDDPEAPLGVAVDRFPIVGITPCTAARWVKRLSEGKGWAEDEVPMSSAELRADGYAPERVDTEIVPVILFEPFAACVDDSSVPEDVVMLPITECDVAAQTHAVVWCRWPEAEDASRLAPVADRLRRKHLDSEARP